MKTNGISKKRYGSIKLRKSIEIGQLEQLE